MELVTDGDTHKNQPQSEKWRDGNHRTQVTGNGELQAQTFGDECLGETTLGQIQVQVVQRADSDASSTSINSQEITVRAWYLYFLLGDWKWEFH